MLFQIRCLRKEAWEKYEEKMESAEREHFDKVGRFVFQGIASPSVEVQSSGAALDEEAG